MEIEQFSPTRQRHLLHALASFLEVPVESIEVEQVLEGSVIMDLALERRKAEALVKAFEARSPELLDLLAELPIESISRNESLELIPTGNFPAQLVREAEAEYLRGAFRRVLRPLVLNKWTVLLDSGDSFLRSEEELVVELQRFRDEGLPSEGEIRAGLLRVDSSVELRGGSELGKADFSLKKLLVMVEGLAHSCAHSFLTLPEQEQGCLIREYRWFGGPVAPPSLKVVFLNAVSAAPEYGSDEYLKTLRRGQMHFTEAVTRTMLSTIVASAEFEQEEITQSFRLLQGSVLSGALELVGRAVTEKKADTS